ncbi:MAG: hypothetical protein ACRDMV_24025 [Streptosporangiales bacterium]
MDAEGHARIWVGGSPGAEAVRLTFQQIGDAMLTAGLAGGDLDEALALCRDPSFSFLSQTTVAAWGRRPP